MRVRLFNAKFSPNLGDGLLSECLEQALIAAGCSKDATYSIDVAARTQYAAGGASRSAVLQILHRLPGPFRRLALMLPLTVVAALKWRPHYRQHLQDAEAVVIGGGNLFADLDLNFPTKLSILLDEAKRRSLPVFIYGVGVSSGWSKTGTRMVEDAFKGAQVRFVAVRDAESKANFDSRFARTLGRTAEVVRDPGLLISRYVPREESADQRKPVIGLCITSAIAVRYHSAYQIGDKDLEAWFVDLYRSLHQAGYAVQLFTNGSPEDVETAANVIAKLGGAAAVDGPRPRLRPNDPSELASLISTCALVVGFRMHALIAAYSYGLEIIALKWDRKLDSFMASVGLGKWIVWPGDVSATKVVELVGDLLTNRQNRNAVAVDEALQDVEKLAVAMRTIQPGIRARQERVQ